MSPCSSTSSTVSGDVSQIDAGIRQLEPLLQYFFDGVRKKETETLLAAYRKAYSKISLVPGRHELGRFTYGLMLEGRDITCSVMPSLRSETAVALVVAPSDAGCLSGGPIGRGL